MVDLQHLIKIEIMETFIFTEDSLDWLRKTVNLLDLAQMDIDLRKLESGRPEYIGYLTILLEKNGAFLSRKSFQIFLKKN